MTIMHALALAMAAGGLFGGAYEVSRRGPVSEGQRAFPGALRQHPGVRGAGSAAAAPAPRIGVGEDARGLLMPRVVHRPLPLTTGEGKTGHGLTVRVPSPEFILAAARYGAVPSYAAYLDALRRINTAGRSAPAAPLRTPQRRA